MTKQEILKIIDQNRDLLTPENYQGVIKYIDSFSEEEKQRIVDYLTAAQRMIRANQEFAQKRNTLLKQAVDAMKEENARQTNETRRGKEARQARDDASEAESLLSDI